MTTSKNTVVGIRDQLVNIAYELYTRTGVRAVTADMIAQRAGVDKPTLYKYFPTLDELVTAVLERRERLWTFGLIEEQSRLRGTTPEEQLLAIFDVFDEWIASADFDACLFINVLLEMGADHPLGRAGIEHLQTIRDIVHARAERAGLADPDNFARCWHILMKGAVIAAAEGDRQAARRAKAMAAELIRLHRPSG
ncbi:TetR/AcrR family transcriptional regulator [Nocardia sp. CDC153]|uniref:TetR/AcrR family transcriptional regulator n=1 Tax=Nocardia sp. CDC153 TaxID=3112167 RepID=UPI002DB9A791|nr:TetR/AcrR family transcriptional regulator [Nocardia sp. CDC153]MEC3953608.1 TetR/AcrR family transcriptional regulator [Nocardia sp. CDC153]